MKMSITTEELNPNSAKENDLILYGIRLGTYNYGVYSKILIMRMKANKPFATYEGFICNMIHNYFGIDAWSSSDIEKAKTICKEKEHIELIDWINNSLLEMSSNYED